MPTLKTLHTLNYTPVLIKILLSMYDSLPDGWLPLGVQTKQALTFNDPGPPVKVINQSWASAAGHAPPAQSDSG